MTETKDENGNVVRAIDTDVLRQESRHCGRRPAGTLSVYMADKKKSVVLANQLLQKRCALTVKSLSAKTELQEILIQKTSISKAITWMH